MHPPADGPQLIHIRDNKTLLNRDSGLLQIVDAALAETAQRAGPHLACRPGCTQCCYGVFPINALDVLRLHAGMEALHRTDPSTAEAIEARAQTWLATYGPDFPGDLSTGILGTSEEDQSRFESFADDAPCPALNPSTGLCDVYAWRPLTCRVFGPPTRPAEDEALACCELCFIGATETEIAACEMPVPHALESELVAAAAQIANPGENATQPETLVAFALLNR